MSRRQKYTKSKWFSVYLDAASGKSIIGQQAKNVLANLEG
jgi:hypothetical protein